jgi:hypothetical protein
MLKKSNATTLMREMRDIQEKRGVARVDFYFVLLAAPVSHG